MKDKGFSLVQIIVSITAMGVFGGVVCPFGVRVAENRQKMMDVYEANEIAHQFQLMASCNGGFDCDIIAENEEGTCVIDWQKEELMQASGMTEDEIMESWAEAKANGQDYLDKMLFFYLDKIPESATNSDYGWNLCFDVDSGKVETILLVEKDASGDVVSEMEVYPNYSDFIKAN